jgi:hypothetical protein
VDQAALLHSQQCQANSQTTLLHTQQYEQDRSERLVQLQKQEEAETNKLYLAVLGWFSAAQSTGLDHDTFCGIRNKYTGSGRWILKDEKVQNWMELDTPVSSLLWLNGIPGAGILEISSCILSKTLGSC